MVQSIDLSLPPLTRGLSLHTAASWKSLVEEVTQLRPTTSMHEGEALHSPKGLLQMLGAGCGVSWVALSKEQGIHAHLGHCPTLLHSQELPQCRKCPLCVGFGDPASTALSRLPGPHVQKGCSARAIPCLFLEFMGTFSSNVNRYAVDYWMDMPLYWGFSSIGFFSPGAQQVQSWYLMPVSVIK